MNNIMFTERAWEEYCYWQNQDRKTLKNELTNCLLILKEMSLQELVNQNH